jgi:hypothetical protein
MGIPVLVKCALPYVLMTRDYMQKETVPLALSLEFTQLGSGAIKAYQN